MRNPRTSRSRITARPPMARPSASTGWPAVVVSAIAKLSPLSRKRLDRALHRERLVGRQPQAEGQHALRLSRRRNDGDVADDFGLVGGRRPGHDDLRLREQQRLRAVDIGGERRDLLAEKAVGFGGLPAAANQQDRIHHRETQNAERQPECREFVPLEFGEGGHIEIDGRELARLGGMGRQWKAGQRETREESASPRIGVTPPALARIMPAFRCPEDSCRSPPHGAPQGSILVGGQQTHVFTVDESIDFSPKSRAAKESRP